MLFNSFIFFIFLAVILPIFYILPNKTSRNVFLLMASYLFYGYWDWRFCSLLLTSTVVDFFIGQALYNSKSDQRKKLLLITSMCVNLGILGFFKYCNFFIDSFQNIANTFGGHFDFVHLNIILPVGISFYTFQTMSYTIDIYRKRLKPTNNIIDFALFVSFFPQLVAGPIERASALLPQLYVKLSPSKDQIKKGIHLIIIGLFKKVMIGDASGRIVDHIFTNPSYYSSLELIVGLMLFSLQIYADFSGYSSIARGVAKLLGVELMKNFEQPYLSRNITEFWRRWHISLSSWLKDYLYITIGGNRKGVKRTYVNLFITMLLGGLWHGASWNFVIWGALHGLYLSIHKLILKENKVSESYSYTGVLSFARMIFQVLGTYILVLFAWLFFRATNLDTVSIFLSKMLHWETSLHSSQFIGILLAFLLVSTLIDVFEYKTGRHTFLLSIQWTAVRVGVLGALLLVTVVYMYNSDPLPFVYFQF